LTISEAISKVKKSLYRRLILLLSLSKLNFFTFWEAYDSSAPNKQINQESCNQSNNTGSAAKLP
jgi:hypothetical protein